MKRSPFLFSAAFFLVSLTATAQDLVATQKHLQTIFSNTPISSVGATPVPGLFEVNTKNAQTFFVHPESQLVFFGEIYDFAGNRLSRSLKETSLSKLRSHSADALHLGQNGPEIFEFSNPDCHYCKDLSAYLNSHPQPVSRRVFFTVPSNSLSERKAIHILCSENPEQAYEDIYSGHLGPLTDCQAGRAKLALHASLSRSLNIVGTPTMYLDDPKPIYGFDPKNLNQRLKEIYYETDN